jgi:hypothetical protein
MRYLLALVILGLFLLGWLPPGLAVASLFSLSLWRPRNPRRAGLYLRRDGSVPQRVSSYTSHPTAEPHTTSTASWTDGLRLAEPAGLALHHRLSSATAPTFFTSGAAAVLETGGSPGTATAATTSLRFPPPVPPCGCPETAA